jgi:hypothetical protein
MLPGLYCADKCKTDIHQADCICHAGAKDILVNNNWNADDADAFIATQCDTPLPYPTDYVKWTYD